MAPMLRARTKHRCHRGAYGLGEEEKLMIACFIRYELDPFKTAEFERYARA